VTFVGPKGYTKIKQLMLSSDYLFSTRDLRHDADVPTLHRGVLRKGAKIDRSKLVALQTKESKAAKDNQMMAAAAAAEKAQAEAQAQAVTQAQAQAPLAPPASNPDSVGRNWPERFGQRFNM
jgi:hypothetical protein